MHHPQKSRAQTMCATLLRSWFGAQQPAHGTAGACELSAPFQPKPCYGSMILSWLFVVSFHREQFLTSPAADFTAHTVVPPLCQQSQPQPKDSRAYRATKHLPKSAIRLAKTDKRTCKRNCSAVLNKVSLQERQSGGRTSIAIELTPATELLVF